MIDVSEKPIRLKHFEIAGCDAKVLAVMIQSFIIYQEFSINGN